MYPVREGILQHGKKKLLRKVENRNFPNFITTLHAQGERIYVGDVQESFHFVKYKKAGPATSPHFSAQPESF